MKQRRYCVSYKRDVHPVRETGEVTQRQYYLAVLEDSLHDSVLWITQLAFFLMQSKNLVNKGEALCCTWEQLFSLLPSS